MVPWPTFCRSYQMWDLMAIPLAQNHRQKLANDAGRTVARTGYDT